MAGSAQGAKRRGKTFERQVRARLQDDGYYVVMSAGSMSVCDMVAIKSGEVLFIQCKAGPSTGTITPRERADLLQLQWALPHIGKAVIAYQVQEDRAHVTRFKRLTGAAPHQWQAWRPDQVGGLP